MPTFGQAIAGAHRSLNDSARVRYPDVVTFAFAQDAIREIYALRPDLWVKYLQVFCGQGDFVGRTMVDAAPAGAEYVLDVVSVWGGRTITKGDLQTMNRYRPNWKFDPPGPTQHWFPLPTDDGKRPSAKFLVYPQYPDGQSLIVQVVGKLSIWADLTNEMQIPDHLLPAVESYIIFRCEMADDEHIVQQRAQAAYTNFATLIGLDQKASSGVVLEGRPQ